MAMGPLGLRGPHEGWSGRTDGGVYPLHDHHKMRTTHYGTNIGRLYEGLRAQKQKKITEEYMYIECISVDYVYFYLSFVHFCLF